MKTVKYKLPNLSKALHIMLTKDEAYRLIESLASQLYHKNPNKNRAEWTNTPLGFFTVSVDFEEESKK